MKHYKVDYLTELKPDDQIFCRGRWTTVYGFDEDKGIHTSLGWICRTELYDKEPVATEENHNIQVIRYRDKDGNPTCAADFECGKVCVFYRTQKFGCRETCVFAKEVSNGYTETMERRGEDQTGTLIPLSQCPVWEGIGKE